MTKHEFLAHMEAALSASIGIRLATNDSVRLRQNFYTLRRLHPDPRFHEIKFIPQPDELWLVKKERINEA